MNPFRPHRPAAQAPSESPTRPAAHEDAEFEGAEATDLPQSDERDTQIAALEAELARAKDGWLRAEADLQNARRRANREVDDASQRAQEDALALVLPFIDDLERALEAAERTGEAESPLAKGVALVLSRLLDGLARSGAIALDPKGQPFDPREHEALLTAASEEHAAGTVAQVIARGYKLRDRLLRPARVVVSSGPGTAPDEGA